MATDQSTAKERLIAMIQKIMSTLYYMAVETVVGTLYVAFWGGSGMLVMISFEDEPTFKDAVRRRFHVEPILERDPPELLPEHIQETVRLERPFPGYCDLSRLPASHAQVLVAVCAIPLGETRTYTEVALDVGLPRQAALVEDVLLHNPLPMILPCHRVIRDDGTPGGYVEGKAAMKQVLLSLERGVA